MKLKKIIRNIVIAISFLMLALYLLLINFWRIDYTQEEITSYISEIKQAERLPDLCYELYNLDTNNALEYGTIVYLTKSLCGIKTNAPVSIWLAKVAFAPKKESTFRFKSKFKEFSLAAKIDTEISSREQLNFLVAKIDFAHGQVGIKSAAKFYFNKELNELNETEVASLIVMLKNPALYSPIRRPEKLKLEVDKLLQKQLQ